MNVRRCMPPLPLALVSGTGQDVTVAEHRSRSLTPGAYGAVVLHEHSTLRLAAGKYTFASVKMGEDCKLLGDVGAVNRDKRERSGVDVRIVDGLQMAEHAQIAPHDDDDTKAQDFTIAVAGSDRVKINDPDCCLAALARQVRNQ